MCCAACGSPALVPHLAVGGGGKMPGELVPTIDRFGEALSDVVRCRRCGHMQLDRPPRAAQLAEAYAAAASDAYVAEERGERATARRTLDRIERYAGRGALLDVGCWVGFLLDEARRRGWRTLGVEPSEFASEYARERLGLDVLTAGLETSELDGRRFDAVVLGDVLEHLVDPGAALGRIRGLLVPGGVVSIVVPDAGSRVARALGARWWSVIPTHVHYFTRRSVATLLDRSGFRLERLDTAPKAFSVRYYLGRLRGYSPRAAGALVRAAEAAGVAERLWAPDFRDRMAVIARRAS